MVMQEAIRALVDGPGLDADGARQAMAAIMSGEATPAQIGAFLAALRVRGETPEVVAASAEVMQAHAEPVPVDDVVDICGTGGDGIDTFNVSTAAGFVLAACGVRVAKHGNRAASSRCGSADVLEALGARIDLGGEQAAAAIERCGFAFLFAQRFHPAMRHVGGPRRELGVRTVFNLLGPLTNPARPRAQLAGVGARHLGPLLAGAFAFRGMTAMVVHSTEGIDELSPAGPSLAWLVQDGQVTETELSPVDFGLPEHPLAAVAGGDPAENAATMRRVLGGEPGPMADFVTLNAGAALVVAGRAENYHQGATMARSALDGGAALLKLDEYIALTQELMA